MASLQARSPLRSAQSLIVLNKLVSLTAFGILLIAGCLLLCYVKFDLANRWRSGSTAPASTGPAIRAQATESTVALPPRLVYACAEDTRFFHSPSHLPAKCQRTGLTEEAARQRGLKPCSVCLPE